MNAFARGLFQLLIGWVRSLTALWDGDWTRLDSFFAWVTDRHGCGPADLAAALAAGHRLAEPVEEAAEFFRPGLSSRGPLSPRL